MSFGIFSCFALPLWCACFALYFILRRNRLMRESLVAKCAGTFLAVGSAGFAFCLRGEALFTHGFFWFFLLCMAADALLELQFLPGMLLFAVAHICWILEAWSSFSPRLLWSLPVWAAAMLAALLLFRRELPKMGVQVVFCCLYVAVLSTSLALALPLPLLSGKVEYLPLSLGMLSFFVSDMMVAKSEFSHLGEKLQKPIMALYWLALYLISTALWL